MRIDDEMIDRFLTSLTVSEKSRSTYRVGVRVLGKYLTTNEITEPNEDDLLDWLEVLETLTNKATQNLYLVSIRKFFQWTELEGLYPNIANHLKGAKLDRDHKKDYLTAAQVSDILANMDTDTLKGKRDKALFLLMVTGGLRTIEVSRANVEDLRTLGGYSVLYIQGKGHTEKAEFIKVSAKTEKAIREYLNARKAKTGEPLFTNSGNNNGGGAMTAAIVSRTIKAILKSNGFDSDRLTAHSLRHTAVTLALQSGCEFAEVQQFAHHQWANSTAIYYHHKRYTDDNTECPNAVDKLIKAR